jgi:hypothetical protein
MRTLDPCIALLAASLLAQDLSLTNGNVSFAVEFNNTSVVY